MKKKVVKKSTGLGGWKRTVAVTNTVAPGHARFADRVERRNDYYFNFCLKNSTVRFQASSAAALS